ncbi:hypothetical protein BHE74_00059250 [Ensete ventricosum]|nr:hypothetical protein BHE74_00059250 [Ensete ventricosum]
MGGLCKFALISCFLSSYTHLSLRFLRFFALFDFRFRRRSTLQWIFGPGHVVLTKKMRSLTGLGIALSIIPGCLFLALVAELSYLFWWKKNTNRARELLHLFCWRKPSFPSSTVVVNPREISAIVNVAAYSEEGRQRLQLHSGSTRARELLHLSCWRKPSFPSSTEVNPQEISATVDVAACSEEGQLRLHSSSSKGDDDDTVEAELMRLHSLAGPPRCLFTINEESKEDSESEDVRSGGKKSWSDSFDPSDTPYLTPLSSPPFSTPPLTPLGCYKHSAFNPLFDSSKEEDFFRI